MFIVRWNSTACLEFFIEFETLNATPKPALKQ